MRCSQSLTSALDQLHHLPLCELRGALKQALRSPECTLGRAPAIAGTHASMLGTVQSMEQAAHAHLPICLPVMWSQCSTTKD